MTQEAEKFPEGKAKSGKRKTAQEKPANPILPFEEVAAKVLPPDPLAAAAAAATKESDGSDESKTKKTEQNKPPSDLADIASLFQDTGQGDPLAEVSFPRSRSTSRRTFSASIPIPHIAGAASSSRTRSKGRSKRPITSCLTGWRTT